MALLGVFFIVPYRITRPTLLLWVPVAAALVLSWRIAYLRIFAQAIFAGNLLEIADRRLFERVWTRQPRADMNGDGHPDIIHGPPRKAPGAGPVIFLGDGKGSWSRWREARFPPLAYDYGDVQVGDFNGDGHQDLAFAVHLRSLIALLGDGKGGFRNASEGSISHSAEKPHFHRSRCGWSIGAAMAVPTSWPLARARD